MKPGQLIEYDRNIFFSKIIQKNYVGGLAPDFSLFFKRI